MSQGTYPAEAPTSASDRRVEIGLSDDMDLTKLTTPILVHLIARELKFPRLFLLKCKLTVGRFKRTIDPRFPQDLIELAALPLWVYLNLKKRLGQKGRSK